MAKPVLPKVLRVTFLLVISSLTLNSETLVAITSAESLDSFNYEFVVNEDGFTTVNILYITDRNSGSPWVLVPKFSEWTNLTIRGEVTEWSLCDAESLTGVPYYFYEALCFSFNSDGSEFRMNVQFNLSIAAMVIEPDGIFYSPQIGFEKGKLRAEVWFPDGFKIKRDEALAIGSRGSYPPRSMDSLPNYVVFDNVPPTENLLRIEVGFTTPNETAESITLRDGVFTFKTVPRYEKYARRILDLYNWTYSRLIDLFNVTLESAEVRFFLPDFASLFSVGGYVPFLSERMGDIHINIVFTRYVRGYIEVIALHELVHHFIWKASVSPQTLLWFHEGMAQYVSIEFGNRLGYEGSEMMRQELEDGVSQLKQSVGENFGFLEEWSMSHQPQDSRPYYIAAYYVVSKLAELHGGLEYFARFFRELKGETVDNDVAIGYYLSLAADESVVGILNNWGFDIPDLYVYSPLLGSAEEVLDEVNPVYQPYKSLAELLYRQALVNARGDRAGRMQLYLAVAMLIARLAPLLTLITASGVLFGAILLALKVKGVFSDY